MAEISKELCGVAGEYFVAAELSRRGYIASITLGNTKGIDILVSNENATRQVGIQVKTNQNTKEDWMLNKKAEDYFADNLFYVFVNLKQKDERPDFYVIHSRIFAEQLKSTLREWLDTPGRNGQPHKDNPIRKFNDSGGDYLEKWEILDL